MPDLPAGSAPAAPAAAPVASPAPVASAPAAEPAVAAPAVADGSPAPVIDAAPAVAAAVTAPEPKQDDYPGDVVSFLEAHNAWERGDEVKPVEGETKPAEAETKPAEPETKPVDEDKPWAPEPEVSLTPESLNALAQKSPELQAAINASPEVKQALFAMARINAKAAPILELLPNVEAAKFAVQASNTFVDIRTNFLEAVDNPESFPNAYARFADEFAIKDKDGKPVLDDQGYPQYEEDFHMLNDHVVDTYHAIEMEDLEAQVQANQFASDDAREQASMALEAFKFIKAWKAGEKGIPKPDLSNLSPEAKAYYEQKEREIEQREAALGGKEKKQTAEQRQAERATYETNVAKKVGASVGARLKAMIADDEKAGVFLPSYITQAKDPETGISMFAKTLVDEFEEATYGRTDRATGKVIGGVAYIRDQARMLRNRLPSADAELARVNFVNGLVEDFLPAIYNKNKRELQNKDRADRERRQGSVAVRDKMAEREPAGGAAPQPKALDAQSAMKEAYAWVDKTFPDLEGSQRLEKALIKKNELTGARY